MNYYPFHIGDFRSGTVNMSRQSRWIYRDMLDVYYDTEKPLPLDFDRLCAEVGVDSEEERRIVERLLRFKFEKTEDGYCNEVCDRVIVEYRAKAETAKANGKRGGRPRKPLGTKEEPSGFPSGSDQEATGTKRQTGSKTNQEPITNNQEPDGEKPVAVAPHLADLPPELLKDFLVVRKAKKAGALTPTALKGIEREGKKAGLTLVETITACCEFGWQGFNAQWYADRNAPKAVSKFPDKNATPPVSSIWHESAAGIDAKAQELSLEPIGPLESRPAFKARVMAAARESVPA